MIILVPGLTPEASAISNTPELKHEGEYRQSHSLLQPKPCVAHLTMSVGFSQEKPTLDSSCLSTLHAGIRGLCTLSTSVASDSGRIPYALDRHEGQGHPQSAVFIHPITLYENFLTGKQAQPSSASVQDAGDGG